MCGRFQSLNIPQGATITQAYITFTGTETETTTTRVAICGENSDDADAFSSSDDDITDRPHASTIINWNIGSWVNNGQYNTPDLKDIVESIVGRSGWSSGNDMAFIFKPDGGDRDAYTHDDNSSKAPLLTVVYETGSSSNTNTGQVCYNTTIDELTVPAGASMTTDNIESAQFNSGGNTDENNDFGLWGGALPVEWLSVNARWVPNGAEVVWSTGSEDNNSHFNVERTIDGQNWETIGRVTGAGYATTINTYSFIDETPGKDINYYRVKQVDFDGQFDYSDVVVISNGGAKDELSLNVYPNPANNYVYVKWNKDSRNSEVRILDINGKLMAAFEPNSGNATRIDLTNFDTGIYFLKYNSGTQEIVKRLVIKH